MGKRGPRSKVTTDIVDIIRERYHGGLSHRAIAEELKISETNIRRILNAHGIAKREKKLATLLTAAEESAMVDFLISHRNFRGKYRDLRNLMDTFVQEQGISCPFTYSWRNGFVKRHSGNREIPVHLLHVLSPKNERAKELFSHTDFEDSDLTVISQTVQAKTGIVGPTIIDVNALQNPAVLKRVTAAPILKGPSVWRQKPKLTLAQRAIKESTKAFLRAGLSREEANELLVKLKVPGISEPGHDVVAAAISDVFGEADIEPELAQAVTEQQAAEAAMLRKATRKAPQKKDQLQIELLEKVYAESPVCGDQRAKKLATLLGLTPAQIIYWFHNTARHRRKITGASNSDSVEESAVVTEVTDDFNLVPIFGSS